MIARLWKGNEIRQEIPLRYAGKVSTFDGQLTITSAGQWEVEVLAMDPSNANFGRAEIQRLPVVRRFRERIRSLYLWNGTLRQGSEEIIRRSIFSPEEGYIVYVAIRI